MIDQRTKARLAVSEFQSASRAKLEAERDFTRAHDQLGKLLDDLIAESEGLRRLHYLENKAKDTTDSDIEEMNNLRRRLGLVTPMSTKPYRPISAAEGDFFIAAQCGNCTKQDGCRIVLLTMRYHEDDIRYPKEWVSDADGNNPRCTAREVTLATVLAEDMVPTDREEPGSVTFTAAEVEHLRGLVRLRAAAQRVVKERDALRTECDDLRRVFSLVHGSLGIQQGEHIGNAIDALKKERDELATRLRQSIARGDFAEMRLATLAAELETERERHRQTAGLEWPLSCVEVVKGGDK